MAGMQANVFMEVAPIFAAGLLGMIYSARLLSSFGARFVERSPYHARWRGILRALNEEMEKWKYHFWCEELAAEFLDSGFMHGLYPGPNYLTIKAGSGR
jgi:hypothetical protein